MFIYHLKDDSRKLIKLVGRKEEHVLFHGINFCRCDSFKNYVLEGKSVTCEHILAVKLAKISGDVEKVQVTDLQIKEMLDDELKQFEGAN